MEKPHREIGRHLGFPLIGVFEHASGLYIRKCKNDGFAVFIGCLGVDKFGVYFSYDDLIIFQPDSLGMYILNFFCLIVIGKTY